MFDLIIKGGRVYDGSGMPSFTADVAVREERSPPSAVLMSRPNVS